MKCSAFRLVLGFTGLAAFLTVVSNLRQLQAHREDWPNGPDALDETPEEVLTAPTTRLDRSGEARAPETWIILLAFQRSGTHWLTQELSRHPCIYVAGEILLAPGLKEDWWSPQKRRAGIKTFYNISLTPEEATLELPAVSGQWATEAAKALAAGKFIRGFNWKVSQGFLQDLPWIKSFIAGHKVKLIWLQRHNMLRRYLSMMSNRRFLVAATTDQSEAKRIKKEKVPIPVPKLLKDLKAREEEVKELQLFFKELKGDGHEVLQVVYEELADRMDQIRGWTVKDTGCSVAGETATESEPGYQKLHPGNISDMVENWKEVVAALKKTKWEWMLNS
ncbi:unnamed protein product [Durusdinium trenchii]|uniref:Uncharacterized protein n=2 Tax=Durusdinium trenchii TaxID=1381693 RepID=A0ABP0R3Z2_9DINO